MDKTEYSSEEDEHNEETTSFRMRPRFIMICVDVSHKERASDFLNFLRDILKNLYKSPFKLPKFGIVFVGGVNESVEIVLDPLKDFRTEYEQFIMKTNKIQEGSFLFPLKEILTFATQFLIKNETTANEEKKIVLITDTVNPKLQGEEMQKWACIKDIEQANIKFVIAPLTKVDLTTSDVYEELATFIEKFEVNDSNRILLEILSRSPRRPEIMFYYHEHNYITFYNSSLFSDKYPVKKLKPKRKQEIINTQETEVLEPMIEIEGITKGELRLTKNYAIPAGRKSGYLELLYVMSNSAPLPMPKESHGIFISPKKYDPASVALASHFWNYCTSNDKILICLHNTKRVRKAYLRPSMFKGEFGFIMQSMGYLDDFNLLDSKEFLNTHQSEPPYKKTMLNIINALKVNKSTLSISDPKVKHYNAMVEAKKAGISLEKTVFEDETSKDYNKVKYKVAEFVDEFISLTMRDVSSTEPAKKRSVSELKKDSKGNKKERKAF